MSVTGAMTSISRRTRYNLQLARVPFSAWSNKKKENQLAIWKLQGISLGKKPEDFLPWRLTEARLEVFKLFAGFSLPPYSGVSTLNVGDM